MADIPARGEIEELAARADSVAEDLSVVEAAQSKAEEEHAQVDRRIEDLRARAQRLIAGDNEDAVTSPYVLPSAPVLVVSLDSDQDHIGSQATGREEPRASALSQANELLVMPPELESAISKAAGALPPVAHPMDAWDVAASVCAGLAGALVDFLWVRIPKDITYMGTVEQRGSAVTNWLKSFDFPDDNWLSQFVKTSFDRVRPGTYSGPAIPGLNPRQHRMLTLGHDPILGIVFGILDTVMGTMSGVDQAGKIFIRGVTDAPNAHNWALAPLVWVGHLMSDVATKMGLPIPGWGLTQLLTIGKFGPNNRTVAELARWMYLNGYDLRHFMSMGLSVGAVELVVRGYCLFRYGFQPPHAPHSTQQPINSVEAQRELDFEVLRAGFEKQRMTARQDRILLAAHALAAGANAVKVGVYAGNPLAINVAEWARTLHSLARVAGVWIASKPRRELERLLINRSVIDASARDLLADSTGIETLLLPAAGAWSALPALVPPAEFEGAL